MTPLPKKAAEVERKKLLIHVQALFAESSRRWPVSVNDFYYDYALLRRG